jgi:valyl-tRNA synthetase
LLHPFTPFVTEELWGYLKQAAQGRFASAAGGEWERALILAHWPEATPIEAWESPAVMDFSLVMELIRAIRNLRSEKNVKPGRRIPAVLSAGGAAGSLRLQAATLAALAHLDENSLQIVDSLPAKPQGSIALVVGPVEVYLPLAGLVDVEVERARLKKELSDTEAQVQRLEKLLGSSFAEKAPGPVVQKERDKLAAFKDTAQKLEAQIAGLS